MSNMSYCRFHNTLIDLRDCEDCICDMDLSDEENKNRIHLIEICRSIAKSFEDEDLEEYFKNNKYEWGNEE